VAREVPAGSAEEKIILYAEDLVGIQQRLAPVFVPLRDAAAVDPATTRLWREISERRARNMRAFAADLRSTDRLPGGRGRRHRGRRDPEHERRRMPNTGCCWSTSAAGAPGGSGRGSSTRGPGCCSPEGPRESV